jgi:hypothetical protein
MKTTQLEALLSRTIPARLPILIVGAPGVGKSDIVTNAAQTANADLILSHPPVEDPCDAKGLPMPDGHGGATFLPFGNLAHAVKSTRPTVWFLDDLGQATAAVQASYMQLLLARRVNGHILPDHVTFIAATNRRTDRAGVTGILEPVKSRFAAILEVEPNLDDWTAWALTHEQPAEIVAFLRFRPELLHKFNPTADLVNQPSPRTWAHAGKIIGLQLPLDLEFPALVGAVGEGAAGEFTAFLRTYRDLPNLDGILIDPAHAIIPTSPAGLYAVSAGLAHRATAGNFARIAQYAERLRSEGHGEFAVLTVRDCARRKQEILSTPAFAKLASGELGALISG